MAPSLALINKLDELDDGWVGGDDNDDLDPDNDHVELLPKNAWTDLLHSDWYCSFSIIVFLFKFVGTLVDGAKLSVVIAHKLTFSGGTGLAKKKWKQK